MLNYLQQNQSQLTQQQQHIMQDLQQRYLLQQQHQQVIKMQQQQQQQMNQSAPAGHSTSSQLGGQTAGEGLSYSSSAAPLPPQYPGTPSSQSNIPDGPPSSQATSSGSAPGGILPPDLLDTILPKEFSHPLSDQELASLLSRQDIATSLAEDLLKQFAQTNAQLQQQQQQQQQQQHTIQDGSGHEKDKKIKLIPKRERKACGIKTELTVDTVLGVKQKKQSEQAPSNYSINMTSAQILAAVQGQFVCVCVHVCVHMCQKLNEIQ